MTELLLHRRRVLRMWARGVPLWLVDCVRTKQLCLARGVADSDGADKRQCPSRSADLAAPLQSLSHHLGEQYGINLRRAALHCEVSETSGHFVNVVSRSSCAPPDSGPRISSTAS